MKRNDRNDRIMSRFITATLAAAMLIMQIPAETYASDITDVVITEEGGDADLVVSTAEPVADAETDDMTVSGDTVTAEDIAVVEEVVSEDDTVAVRSYDETSEVVDVVEAEDVIDAVEVISDNSVSEIITEDIPEDYDRVAEPAAGRVTITLDGKYVVLKNYSLAEHKVLSSFDYEVDKGSTVTFVAEAVNQGYLEAYEVEYVKVGSSKVPLKPDYIKDDEGKVIKTVHYYELADIQADTTITVTRRPKQVKSGLGFTIRNEAVHSQFVAHDGITGSGVSYKFRNGVAEFGFEIRSEGTYVPKITVGHMEGDVFVTEGQWTSLPELCYPSEAVNKSGTGVNRFYRWIPAYVFAGKIMRITETDRPEDRYYIVNTTNIEKLTARVNGRYYEVKPHGGSSSQLELWFPLFSRVTVSITPKPNYLLREVYVNYDRVSYSSEREVTFNVAGNGNLIINAVGLATLYADDEAYASGKTITRTYSSAPFRVGVYEGTKAEGNSLVITSMTAKTGSRNASAGFATLSDDKKSVTIDPSKEQGQNTTLTLKGKYSDGTQFSKSLIISVTGKSSSVSLKGFKNNEINQRAGTTVSYPVTLSGKNADWGSLTMQASYVDGSAGIPNVTYDPSSRSVMASTFVDEGGTRKLETRAILIQFYYNSPAPENKLGSPFAIRIPGAGSAPAPSKPSVGISSISDVDAILDLTLAKADKEVSNLYYEVNAVAQGVPAAGMKQEASAIVSAGPGTSTVKLQLAENGEKGKGVKQKYTINVKVIQVREYTGDAAADTVEANRIATGAVTTKSLVTKTPSYETSLKLKGNTVSFIRGQDVTLATVTFSRNTSFTDFSADIDGTALDTGYIDGNNIVLGAAFTDALAPGKHTLTVVPAVKGAYTEAKSLTFKVMQRIETISIQVPSRQIYKSPGKAATLKASVEYNAGTIAPAVTRLKWSIGDKNGNALDPSDDRAKYITIKNGTVTVQKQFILGINDDDNYITLIAKADDHAGNHVTAVSAPVLISNEGMIVNDLSIRNLAGNSVTVAEGSEISSLALYVNGVDVAGSSLADSLIIKSNKPAEFGYKAGLGFYATKHGKYRLTVTANDGGKSSRTIDFEVALSQPSSYKLYGGQGIDDSPAVTDVFSDDRVWNADPTQYVLLEPVALGLRPGDYYIRPEIKNVSGASLVTTSGYKRVYRPTGSEMKIVMKTSAGNVTYTVRMNKESISGTLKNAAVTVNSGKFLAPFATGFEFDLDALGLGNGNYKIRFIKSPDGIKAKAAAKADYDAFYRLFEGIGEVEITDGKAHVVIPVNGMLTKGKYKLNAVLYREAAGKPEPVTNTAVLTFTVRSLGSPSMNLKNKYRLTAENGLKDEITVAKSKNIDRYEIYPRLYNVNRGGVVNDFTDYYEIASAENAGRTVYYVRLKDGKDPASIKDADKTGYIRYSYGNQSYYTELGKPRYVKINVN